MVLRVLLCLSLLSAQTAAAADPPAKPRSCTEELAATKTQLATCKDLVAAADEERKNSAELTAQCKKLEQVNLDLTQKCDERDRLRQSKEDELKKSLDASEASTKELQAAVEKLRGDYDRCAQDSLVPWYGRWQLWVGLAGGLLIGGAVVHLADDL
jgi:hypothetical protein